MHLLVCYLNAEFLFTIASCGVEAIKIRHKFSTFHKTHLLHFRIINGPTYYEILEFFFRKIWVDRKNLVLHMINPLNAKLNPI